MRLIVISYWVPDAQQKEFRDSVVALGGTAEFYPGTCFLLINDPDPRLVEKINGHFQDFRTSGNFVVVWDYATSTSSATIGPPVIDWMRQVKDDKIEIAKQECEEIFKKELGKLKEQFIKETQVEVDKIIAGAQKRVKGNC